MTKKPASPKKGSSHGKAKAEAEAPPQPEAEAGRLLTVAFNVRIFGYALVQTQAAYQRQSSDDTMWIPEEPPLWSEVAVANGKEPVAMVFTGPGADNAKVIGVEIPDGMHIRYELQPFGPVGRHARTAGNLSRRLSGFKLLPWTPGATFSFVDAADFP
jgi:hypothetical protein